MPDTSNAFDEATYYAFVDMFIIDRPITPPSEVKVHDLMIAGWTAEAVAAWWGHTEFVFKRGYPR